jgi:hypothetical protein
MIKEILMSKVQDRAFWEEKLPKKGIRALYEARKGTIPKEFPYLDISNGKTTVAHELAKKGKLNTTDNEVLKMVDCNRISVAGFVVASGGRLPESFTRYDLNMLANVKDVFPDAKERPYALANNDVGYKEPIPIACYIAGPLCDQNAFDVMSAKFKQWDVGCADGDNRDKSVIDIALANGKDISKVCIDYTLGAEKSGRFSFMFHVFPTEMIDLDKIERESLYEVSDRSGYTVAGDLVRMGLIPVTSKYMHIREEGPDKTPLLFRYLTSDDFVMSDIDLSICDAHGVTAAHMLASKKRLPADIGIEVLRYTDESGHTVAHTMVARGVKPTNIDRDLWMQPSALRHGYTVAEVAIESGVFPGAHEIDYSITDNASASSGGESLALELVRMGRFKNLRCKINEVISGFSDKEWFSTACNSSKEPENWNGSKELRNAVFSGLSIPPSIPLSTHIDGGTTLAHACAYLGILPEQFDQWDKIDAAGRTVAQIAISGEYPFTSVSKGMCSFREFPRSANLTDDNGSSCVVREYCLKRCEPIPDALLDSNAIGDPDTVCGSYREVPASITLRELAASYGMDIPEASSEMQM